MKKITLLLPALILVFSLSACNKAEEKVNQNINKNQIKVAVNNTPIIMPDWAKELNIDEPKNLSIDQDSSSQTENSVSLVYKSDDVEYLRSEAKRISEKAGLSLQYDIRKELGDILGNMEGIETDTKNVPNAMGFSNSDAITGDNMYLITVSVDEENNLLIDIKDARQTEE